MEPLFLEPLRRALQAEVTVPRMEALAVVLTYLDRQRQTKW